MASSQGAYDMVDLHRFPDFSVLVHKRQGFVNSYIGKQIRRKRHPVLRQSFFFSIVVFLTAAGTWIMADILWRGGLSGIEIFLLVLFIPLYGIISFGFTQAVIGFFVMLLPRDPFLLTATLPSTAAKPEELAPTAIVVPIYNENVTRVYEGIRSIYLSLVKTGCIGQFNFFILSDSSDPNKWIEEEIAWVELCKQLNAFGKIFFRKRNIPLNSKSGNISDFCRRWGVKYRYMIILDADSLMEGSTVVNLVRLMEMNPRAGIVQSVPVPVQADTFYSRMMQFAGTLYGPVFQAGLNFWMDGNGNYWGHNAIIRVAPFIEHCSLPFMPGKSGKKSLRYMSHDYVEAALMRRANYEVWLAYDLDGSYENLPPTLIDNAKRDKRWCRGNLQHSWLLFAEGLHPINRLHLFLGIMSYLSSPLWLVFIIAGIYNYYVESGLTRSYDYDIGVSPFLDDICGGKQSLILFIFTMSMLTLPKFLALIATVRKANGFKSFGGIFKMTLSVVAEHAISVLTAPIHMLFNSRFVIHILMGINVPWSTQRRDAEGVDWREIIITHWPHTVIGIIIAVAAWMLNPVLCYWLSPIFLGIILSIPLSIVLSDLDAGIKLRKSGFFITPQENNPPQTVAHLEKNLKMCASHVASTEWAGSDYGLLQVVLDPYVNAIHVSLLMEKRKIAHKITDNLLKLEERFLASGPNALSRREQMILLMHAEAMADIHQKIWSMPEKNLAQWWQLSIKYYNTLSIKPSTPLYR